MTRRVPICIAFAGNCALAVATFTIYGWDAQGAHAVARNTARFSMLWFVVGFAAPGLARFSRALPGAATTLIHSFVAAHLVHFTSVAVLIATFESAHLWQNPGRVAAIVLVGFVLVVGAGITATPRASRLYTAVHQFALYMIFLIFFLASVRNPVKPLRLLAAALALALILRLTSAVGFRQLRMKRAA